MTCIGGPQKASDLFEQALINEGVAHIFALPGEAMVKCTLEGNQTVETSSLVALSLICT